MRANHPLWGSPGGIVGLNRYVSVSEHFPREDTLNYNLQRSGNFRGGYALQVALKPITFMQSELPLRIP
jgi:hypothetical protein